MYAFCKSPPRPAGIVDDNSFSNSLAYRQRCWGKLPMNVDFIEEQGPSRRIGPGAQYHIPIPCESDLLPQKLSDIAASDSQPPAVLLSSRSNEEDQHGE